MALPKFSFNVISQEEFDARRKEQAVAATTAALPAKPPRRFSVAVAVPGVIPKIKKKSDSLVSTHLDFTLPNVPNAQVTIPVFAMLRVPATILYSSLMLLFLFLQIHKTDHAPSSSRPPFRSSKVIPVNSYMEVVGAIPLAPDLVVIVSSASSLMLKVCRSAMAK